jgi:hypothetical protein
MMGLAMYSIAARIDEFGKVGWIGLTIASFALFWPLGVFVLIYLLWSGRMGLWCGRSHERKWDRMERKWEHFQERARRWSSSAYSSSGNAAFDEYRDETLRRLEEEQREFRDFLDRLRKAKDKAEFDQFMAERRAPRPAAEGEPPPAP